MNKRRILAVFAIVVVVASASAQFRFEIGAVAPVSIGYVSGDGTAYAEWLDLADTVGIIPVGNLGVLLESDLGLIKLGVGVRAQTLLLASAAYPFLQMELAMGPLFVDMSVGGYLVGYYGVGNIYGLQILDLLFPDVSVWLGLGKIKNLRLGGGAIGIIPISMDLTAIPYVAYAGLKVVL